MQSRGTGLRSLVKSHFYKIFSTITGCNSSNTLSSTTLLICISLSSTYFNTGSAPIAKTKPAKVACPAANVNADELKHYRYPQFLYFSAKYDAFAYLSFRMLLGTFVPLPSLLPGYLYIAYLSD